MYRNELHCIHNSIYMNAYKYKCVNASDYKVNKNYK